MDFGGPINVADLQDPNPLSLAFVAGCARIGISRHNADFNDGEQEGFGLVSGHAEAGTDATAAAVGYLQSGAGKKKLHRPVLRASDAATH